MGLMEAFRAALAALRASGRPLILLRERAMDEETAASPGDYDFLVPGEAVDAVIETWLGSILETRASCLVHFSKPEKRLVVLFDADADRSLTCDFWRELRVETAAERGRAARVLRYSSLRPHCLFEGDLLRMPAWLELAVYLCHLDEKKKDLASAGVRERLGRFAGIESSLAAGAPGGAECLAPLPAELLAGKTGAGEAAERAAALLAALGMLRRPPSRWEGFRWWRRRTSRSLARRLGAGPVVAVQGPDGSGKTTLIDAVSRRGLGDGRVLEPAVFKRLYRRSIFRFLYKTVRKLRRLRRRDEPKEVVEVALAPFLFAGALINYRLFRLRGGRRTIRVYDRFFTDLLASNRKDGTGALELTRSYRWLGGWAPPPDCAVVLAVDPGTARARKAEMPLEHVRRYPALMTSHYARRPPWNLLVLRTDIPIERSVEILAGVLERVK